VNYCSLRRKVNEQRSTMRQTLSTFYRAMLCIRGTSHGPCVCLCLCLSVTSRCSTKKAKRRITQTTPHDSPGSLVFRCEQLTLETSNFIHGSAMRSLCLVMSECSLSGRGQGHVSNFYIVDLENFASASRRYTADIHNSTVVGLFLMRTRQ